MHTPNGRSVQSASTEQPLSPPYSGTHWALSGGGTTQIGADVVALGSAAGEQQTHQPRTDTRGEDHAAA